MLDRSNYNSFYTVYQKYGNSFNESFETMKAYLGTFGIKIIRPHQG